MNRPVHLSLSRRRLLHGSALAGATVALPTWRRAALAQSTPQAGVPAPDIQQTRDVVYGEVDGTRLLLDVQQPPAREDARPAVILVHGGGLVTSGPGRYELSQAAATLAAAGYVTFNIDYRLFSQADKANPWPAQLDDAQRAVRWVRANAAAYGVDPDRIGAYGWSSGGQLVGFLGTRETRDNGDPTLADFSSKATCAVTLGGVFDMTILYDNSYDNAINAELLGGTMDVLPDAAAYHDFSPISFVDRKSAPFLIFQEGSEGIIPYEHSRRMVAALQAAHVQVSYGWFPTYSHGSWGSWSSSAPETLAFLGRHLHPDR
jgi:acetyl esterase